MKKSTKIWLGTAALIALTTVAAVTSQLLKVNTTVDTVDENLDLLESLVKDCEEIQGVSNG